MFLGGTTMNQDQIRDIISLLKEYKELILIITPIFFFLKKIIDLQNSDTLKLDYSLSNTKKQDKIRFRLLLKTVFNGFLFYIFSFTVISFILFLSPNDTRGMVILSFIVFYFIYLIITSIITSTKKLEIDPYKNYLVNFYTIILFFILINISVLFLGFDINKLEISVNPIDPALITSYLIGRIKLIMILSIVCLLSIYDPSRTYINFISNYLFTYFYNNDNTKVYIYSLNDQKVLCMQKPYIYITMVKIV